jgi:hypothetical protein
MTSLGSFPGAGQYNQWASGRPYGPMLPRSPAEFLSGAFGPLDPLVPMPIDEAGPDGRPEPRRWQYPVGWNLPVGQPGSEGLKLASFGALRRYADIYSVVRAMINIRKDEIAGTAWDVGPTAEAAAQTKGDKGAGKDQRERASKIVAWFKNVDPDYYGFQSWFTSLLEELFVIDAVSIHLHPTRREGKGPFGSNIAALAAINGETIRPLVDIHGATPRPPFPAFQQYLWGVPRSDLMSVITENDLDEMDDRLAEAGMDFDGQPDKVYRADQLLYLPRTRRVWTPYGFSAIEQAVVPITLGLNRQQFLLDYFTEGTIPGVYVIAGESYVTPSQQRNLQDSLNALAGDVAYKHRVIVLPPGSKTDAQKDLTWAKDVDQTVIEQVAMILHIQPHEIGLTPGGRSSGLGGKGMAEEQAHAVSQQRTLPELNWWKETVFNWVIQGPFGQKDLEWKWLGWEEDEDEDKAADIATKYISIGGMSIDEDRVNRGLDPWNLPLTQSPVLISGNTVTPLDSSVPAPPPPPAPGGMPGGPGAGGINANDPAGAALSQAALPTKAGSDKPKDNPLANLTHEKKGKRKKARNELVDRFASNLKDQSNEIADAQKEREKNAPGGKNDKKKDKVTVADLLKWRVKYNDGKLTKIVHDYLLRSYPEKAVEWAKDGDWEFEPHVALKDIDMARRPGGRDPNKVAKIAESLTNGASMDPIVLCQWEDGTLEPADGWHRTLGAEKAGWKEVPAFIGKGCDDYRDLITGHMQDESDSKKKAAVAELAVLRRFLRKPTNKIENFRTAAIDTDVLRLLPDKVEKMGEAEAFNWAYAWVKKGGNPEGLRDWYNAGADGQIDWGSDGDFMQCVDVASEHMSEEDAKGFCNLRHQDAVGGAPGTEKNFSLGAPLSTGLVPYDLAGAPSPVCQRCGSKLDSEGLCPVHGVAVIKFDPGQPRDELGRWTAGEGLPSGVSAKPEASQAGTERVGIFAKTGLFSKERLGSILAGTFGMGASLTDQQYFATPEGKSGALFGNAHDALNYLVSVHQQAATGAAVMKYSADQPRDEHGRWTSGGDGSQTYATPQGNLSIGPWQPGAATPHGSESHTAIVSMRGWRIGSIEHLGDAGMFVASTRTGTEHVLRPGTDLPAQDNALHEAAHWIHDEWARQVKDWPDGWPDYQQAIKFDEAEPRDDAGKWTDGGGVHTDEGTLPSKDVSDRAAAGRDAFRALQKGDSPNIKPGQVASLMAYALAHQDSAPLDLDHVRVAGTRQFGQDGLHIRRDDMPQVPAEKRDEFFKYLRDQNVTVTEKSIDPQQLQPSQDEISVQRTAAMWEAIKSGDKTVTDGIISSQDHYVIDGHHRWAGYTALSFDEPGTTMRTYEVGMDAKPLLDLANKWNEEVGIAHKELVAQGSLNKSALLAEVEAELARRGIQL